MSESTTDMYSGIEGAMDALGAMPTDSAPVTDATTPAGEEPAAQQPQQPENPADPQQPEEGEGFNPEGPGDHTKAFQAYRQQIADLKAQMAQEAQARQQYEAYFANLRAQQEQAQMAEQLEQYTDDPESLAALLQQQQREYQQQAQQQVTTQRLSMAADLARQTFPDFDQQLGKLYANLGPEIVDRLAAQQDNPAMWAYNFAKTAFLTPEEVAAQVESQVQARLAELAPRIQPKTPIASRGIGQLPAAAPNSNAHPMQDTARALNFGPSNPGFDAAYDALLNAAGG